MTRAGDAHPREFGIASLPSPSVGKVKPLRRSEEEFQLRITNFAENNGWRWWHVKDSRKQVVRKAGGREFRKWVPDPEIAGFPDLTLVHPRIGMVFSEVKGDDGVVSPTQKKALNDLATGATRIPRGLWVQVWYPDDWDDVVVPVLLGTYDGPRFHGVPL